MDGDREPRSVSWWAAIILFAISLLAMGASLGLVALAAVAPLAWRAEDRLAGPCVALVALPLCYVAMIPFLTSVLLKPHRRRALWFASLGGVFLILLLFDLSEGTPMLRLWPIYMPLKSVGHASDQIFDRCPEGF